MPAVTHITRMRQRRHLRIHRAPSRRLGRGCLVLALPVSLVLALASIVVALAYVSLTRGLPPVEALPAMLEPPDGLLLQPTRLYDRTGERVILTLENPAAPGRRYLRVRDEIGQMPPAPKDTTAETEGQTPHDPTEEAYFSDNLIKATIAASDPGFWRHGGFSLAGIRQGAHPTLAQRLVSDLLLQDEAPSLRRALRERLLAAQLTYRYGRRQVLEWYLNIASYGRLAYGADAAARLYLGKDAVNLSLAEAALLAAVAQNPALNPQDAPQAALERQKDTLQALLRHRMISPADGIQAIQEELTLQPPARFGQALTLQDLQPQIAPAFAQMALAQLTSIPPSQVERGGLRIITTLDADLQHTAACTVEAQLARLRSREGRIANCQAARLLPDLPGVEKLAGLRLASLRAEVVVLDPLTGQVLALVGDPDAGKSLLADHSSSGATGSYVPGGFSLDRHPAGSLATFFIYLTGFTRGMSPASLVWDIPPPQGDGVLPNLNGIYHGPLRLRSALANDYQQPAEQVMAQVGAENVWRIAQQLGIRFPENPEQSSASALDAFRSMDLLEISQAFAIFANLGNQTGHTALVENGYSIKPKSASRTLPPLSSLVPAALLRVEDVHDQLRLDVSAASSRPILNPQLAYLVTHILSDEAARWQSLGHPNALEIGRPAAVKIGRTPQGKDLWSVGFTPAQVVGVWLGIDGGAQDISSAGEETLTGPQTNTLLQATLGLWRAILQHNSRDLPNQAWNVPEGLSFMEVCDPSGLLPTEACPNMVEEVFLAGTEPIQADTLYRRVPVNRETGRLATVFTPPDRIDNRSYFIAPSNAAAWAEASSYVSPPNVYDTIPLNLPFSPEAHITSPGMLSSQGPEIVRGQVPITGTASGEGFASFRIQVGQGLQPRAWYLVGEDVTRPVQDGRLGVWDSRNLSGLYAIQLVVLNKDQSVRRDTVLVAVDNQPPLVQIISPIKDEEIDAQERNRLVFQAGVSDDLGVARLDFYLDGRLLASLSRPPYALTWTAVPGAHMLRVVAVDQAGNSGEAMVNFTVR